MKNYNIRVRMIKIDDTECIMDIERNFISEGLRDQFLRQFYLFYIMEDFHVKFKENIEYNVSNLLDILKKLETSTLRELLENKIRPVMEIYNYNVRYRDDDIIDIDNENYFNMFSWSDNENRSKEKKDTDKNVNN